MQMPTKVDSEELYGTSLQGLTCQQLSELGMVLKVNVF